MAMSLHPWGVIFKHATEHPTFNSVSNYHTKELLSHAVWCIQLVLLPIYCI